MKECPECSMHIPEESTKCKWCGANLGGGGGGATPGSSKKKEDPKEKEAREKEAKRKKIITYVGYGVIGVALVGYLVYMQWKRSKEPPPEENPAAETADGETTDEAAEGFEEEPAPGTVETSAPTVKKKLPPPKLGKRVTLEDAGLSLQPFPNALVEGAGDAAATDPALVYSAYEQEGTMRMTIRMFPNPEESSKPTGAMESRLESEYITGAGKLVKLPEIRRAKHKVGHYFMFKADLGGTHEQVYHLFTDEHRYEILFSYPSDPQTTDEYENVTRGIVLSIEVASAKADAAAKTETGDEAEKGKDEKKPDAKTGQGDEKAKTPKQPEKPAKTDKPATETDKPAAKTDKPASE